MNLVMLPMWIFSGVFFSASRFPDAIQPLIRALPLTAVINALRASMLQGASLRAIALELAVMHRSQRRDGGGGSCPSGGSISISAYR